MPGELPDSRIRRPRAPAATALAFVIGLAACGSDGRDMRPPEFPLPPPSTAAPSSVPIDTVGPTQPVSALQLVAPWPDLGPIPARNTCDDADLSPALTWSGVPLGTVELALTVVDASIDFTHWIAYGINPAVSGLAEGQLPPEVIVATNDFGTLGWAGPCPPAGDPAHQYVFTLYALNQQVEVADDATSDELIATFNQTAIAQSTVTGTYARDS